MTFTMPFGIKVTRQLKTLSNLALRVRPYSTVLTGRAVRLAYASYQPTNQPVIGPPIIIIHGLFGTKKNLAGLSKALGRSRKVVAVDLRNHGESEHVADMDMPLMAADIELLLSELLITEAVLVGHSLGGKVAMTLALSKPHLVKKLLVEDVSPTISRTADTTEFPTYIAAMQNLQFDHSLSSSEMRKSADEQIQSAVPEKPVRDFIVTNIVKRDNEYTWRMNVDAISSNLDTLMGFPDLDLTYTGPTLFLGGSRSTHITEKERPQILRFFPRAEIRHVEGAGHWVHADKPHDVLKAVLDFTSS